MNATTNSPAIATAGSMTATIGAALIGLALVFVAGHAQGSTLHDAAHDVRHATGFPCH